MLALCFLALLVSPSFAEDSADTTIAAAPSDTVLPDSSRVALPDSGSTDSLVPDSIVPALPDSAPPKVFLFLGTGLAFPQFAERDRFQNELLRLHTLSKAKAETEEDSLRLDRERLDYPTVNYGFPIRGGIGFEFARGHMVILGGEWLYDRESGLVEGEDDKRQVFYTLQAFSLDLGYRGTIAPDFMRLKGHEQFSWYVRWRWLLPGSGIWSDEGSIEARTPWQGAGWAVGLGYQVLEYGPFSLHGNIDYSQLSLESNSRWSSVVYDTTGEKASWDMGGLSLHLEMRLRILGSQPSADDTIRAPRQLRSEGDGEEIDSSTSAPVTETEKERKAQEAKKAAQEKGELLRERIRQLKGE